MSEHLWDRILAFYCRIFGHRFSDDGWVYLGRHHRICHRCTHIISATKTPATVSPDGERGR